jgi:type II secretory pathway component GspD/PulD (secretin)
MKTSKKIISIIVSIAVILIVIEVFFLSPLSKPETESSEIAEPQTNADQNTPLSQESETEPQAVPDFNAPLVPGDANARDISIASARSPQPGEPNQIKPEETGDPNDPMVAVHINNMEMKNIMKTLMDWTGKSIIPTNEAMKARITVFAPDKLPRSKALQLIYSALKIQGYVVEPYDKDTITIKQITDAAKLSKVPIIDSNTPLATIQNKEEIVQKFFKLKNYTPSQISPILISMLGEYGNLTSDDDTRILGVIDTVSTLMRIESVIQQFDTAAAEPMVEDIFEIHYRNPADVIQLLQVLIAERSTGASLKNISGNSSGGSRPEQNPPAPPSPANRRSGSEARPPGPSAANRRNSGSATSVTIGTGRTPPTLIAEPRNSWIIVKATEKDMELIRKWITKLDTPATIIDADTPLASIENKNLVAQRFFRLENYSPTLMIQLVRPMLNNSAYVSAEENTRTLLIVDTVEKLIQAEELIHTFDVPGTELAVPQIFDIQYGDPAEIVQFITMLLSQDGTSSRSGSGSISISLSGSGFRIGTTGRGSSSGSFMPTTSSSMMGGSKIPVVLIPNQERRQIIARAPAEAMQQIEEWIIKLDQKDSIEREYDLIIPKYVDVSEVSSRITSMLNQMPGQEIQKSVLIQPLTQAGQIMVWGRKELRDMIRKLILEIDIPPGILETRYFKLKHADPDLIKTRIDELYSDVYSGSGGTSNTTRYVIYDYYYPSSGRGSSSNMTKDSVRVISDASLRQVTVIASAENMKKIEKQIEEWDIPLDTDSLKPRFIELKNVDPVKMAQFLSNLFTEQETGMTYYQYYGYEDAEAKKKIVGPLYGQLTFEYIPGTKKIIVISKIPEAYDVIEELVSDIDSEEMAEVPTVVTLKFANPERLCEILNATFSQPGASVEILRSDTGLSQYSMDSESESNNNTTSTSQDGYTPWWGTSVSRNISDDERPISNVIGRIRFVPENRTKSILVLSPPEFVKNIRELIELLDVPSKQVMIKAVIVEVDHKNLSSLGVQLATNPGAFGSLEENSIVALNTLQQLDRHGSVIWGAGGDQGTLVTNILDVEVYGLLDFLEKKVNAKILNQQTLWTQNNEEASFFKGDIVAFFTSATSSVTAGNVQDTEFQKVGMNVAVRPSITPNKEVDLNINILMSQLTNDEKNGQPVRTAMETKTKMVVSDGQTLMLGGILFQQDAITKRGVPGLSDIPLLGGLFTHTEKTLVNNEMIVFITPYVYDVDEETGQLSPEVQKQMDIPLDKINKIREELNRNISHMDLAK